MSAPVECAMRLGERAWSRRGEAMVSARCSSRTRSMARRGAAGGASGEDSVCRTRAAAELRMSCVLLCVCACV